MANVLNEVWSQLRLAIGATWTDVLPEAFPAGGAIHRRLKAEKRDWATIPLPYCVIDVQIMRETDFAPITIPTWSVVAYITYVRADGAGASEAIDDKLTNAEIALRAYAFNDGVQFLDTQEMNATQEDEANQVFLQRNEAVSAGTITALLLVGKSIL